MGETRRIFFPAILAAGSVLLLGGAVVGLRLAEQAASDLVDQFRPDLESALSKPLGHPVNIGPYQGLKPWGFQVGRSRILPAAADRSEISLDALTVNVDPLASLRQWRPVIKLRLHGTKIQLRRNAAGGFWVPGTTNPDQSLPGIGLRYELVEPALISVAPLDQTFELRSRGAIELGDEWFSTTANLAWRDRGGSIRLEARGRWDQPELAVRAQLKQLQLNRVALFTPLPSQAKVDGIIQGDLRLQLQPGRIGCQGDLDLKGVEISTEQLTAPLRSKHLKLACQGTNVTVRKGNFAFQDWSADATGSVRVGESFDLRIDLRRFKRPDKLTVRAKGPWTTPQWQVTGTLDLPEDSPLAGSAAIEADLVTPWLDPKQRRVVLTSSRFKAEQFSLGLKGEVFPELRLQSTGLTATPGLWTATPALNTVLGSRGPVQGSLLATGSLQQPSIQLRLNQADNPLLDRWNLLAEWSRTRGIARLKRFESPTLQASADIPLDFENGAIQIGDLNADLTLNRLNLQRLSNLIGTSAAGQLSASGTVNGPLDALRSDFAVRLSNPQLGPLAVPENWSGQLRGVLGEAATLDLSSTNGQGVRGTLRADLTSDGWPSQLELTRQGGSINIQGESRRYHWKADQFVLNGLQLKLPPEQRFESISGRFSGEGKVAFEPLQFSGEMVVNEPTALGVELERIELTGRISDGRFKAEGLLAPSEGNVVFKTSGTIDGPLLGTAEAEGISVPWLVAQTRQLRTNPADATQSLGSAEDLGSLVIETFGGSLDGHLKALARSRTALKAYDESNPPERFDPDKLKGRLDAALNLKGPRPDQLILDLKARGHLWLEGDDHDQMLQMEPIEAVISGPMLGGDGTFSILNLPFSLLALFTNVPPALKGSVGLIGRYRFDGEGPVVSSEVVLENAAMGDNTLLLERQVLNLGPDGINLDLALRNSDSAEPISLRGTIPYRSEDELDLTLESHGDALEFLGQLAGEMLKVNKGTTDLRLILRGSISAPQANGFLVVRNGDILVSGQRLHRINAAMVFDFNRLEIQTLNAEFGDGGTLRGMGAIGLFEARSEKNPLTFNLSKSRLRQSIFDVMAEGKFILQDSLLKPTLEGELTLNQGAISPRQSLLSRVGGSLRPGSPPGIRRTSLLPGKQQPERVTLESLIEADWDFEKPLVLFGPGGAAKPSPTAQAFLPDIPVIQFRNFRLKLGPDLAVRMPPIINFRGGGQLLLNGPLDPNLKARGLIRLNRGRITLFSTTFRLDHRSANVAVFTPSLGLIPYVDIAMKTQVSDSVRVGSDGGGTTSNVFETNGLGTMGPGGGQLRLVKVTVQATGPANRLPGNLSMQSAPPMSQPQILSLIGGNSLAGLAGGGAGTALATVVGQSLLSPVLGTLTDVMGDRLQVALYPTYVTPSVKSEEERTSGRVPPTFTVVSEISADVSDNFDFSVLAAPNNSDVPPQATVSYRINPNTTISGSVDTDGTWQSQLRVFFRF